MYKQNLSIDKASHSSPGNTFGEQTKSNRQKDGSSESAKKQNPTKKIR